MFKLYAVTLEVLLNDMRPISFLVDRPVRGRRPLFRMRPKVDGSVVKLLKNSGQPSVNLIDHFAYVLDLEFLHTGLPRLVILMAIEPHHC